MSRAKPHDGELVTAAGELGLASSPVSPAGPAELGAELGQTRARAETRAAAWPPTQGAGAGKWARSSAPTIT